MMMMNTSGRKTSHGASLPNGRHKKLTKQPSDPGYRLSTIPVKRKEVKDIYSHGVSQENSTKDKDSDSSVCSLRRLSQSGVMPGSNEFQTVLKHFIPEPETEKQQANKSKPSKTKCRKISFNEFGRASRFAKRLEDTSLASPRPKRSIDMLTTPASILSANPDHDKLQNNGTIAQSRKSFPFYGIKEAWHDPERSFNGSKTERRRHVSLPSPPSGFSLDKVTTDSLETLVEPFKIEKPARRKSSQTNNNINVGARSRRKISTVILPDFNNGMTSEANCPSQNNPRKYSPASSVGNETENKMKSRKTTPPHFDAKRKTSGAMGQDLHPNLLLGVKQSSSHEGELSPSLEKQFSAEDTAGEQRVAMKAHKNFKRIGKAALAARRLLRISNDETQTQTISPLAKEEEKQFDEMVEVMKTSYQDMRLDEREKQDSPEH